MVTAKAQNILSKVSTIYDGSHRSCQMMKGNDLGVSFILAQLLCRQLYVIQMETMASYYLRHGGELIISHYGDCSVWWKRRQTLNNLILFT